MDMNDKIARFVRICVAAQVAAFELENVFTRHLADDALNTIMEELKKAREELRIIK